TIPPSNQKEKSASLRGQQAGDCNTPVLATPTSRSGAMQRLNARCRWRCRCQCAEAEAMLAAASALEAGGKAELARGIREMAWFVLLLAGLFEIGWPLGLKLGWTDQGLRIWPMLGSIACMAISGTLLLIAQRTIPMGTAYAV